ncbi:alpha/beta hydrolase [Arthrobacter sp. MYb213]|uniref:alpha/beta fold hydrolase n=1 Tax=Arthrobacter sp. MYb213 TaxID=1848595 RepID=UPI000CFB0C0C|nr:alpha/beta hydrolase [Arthrobacter sp. MYb213]PRB71250.1 alpha/beta hydrolase [Arthrobacter sp. MYb213]
MNHIEPEANQLPEGIAAIHGSGLPVVLVHGNGVDHRILLALDEQLARPGNLQRIYVDLPGFGGTPALAGKSGLPEIADWLQNLLEGQLGAQPFALIGNSLGGLLAQEMADRFEDQILGLVLLAPVIRPAAEERNLPARSIIHEDEVLLEELGAINAGHYAQMSVLQTRANWEQFEKHVLPGVLSADLRAMAHLSKRYYLETLPVDRDQVWNMPVLIACGMQDHIVGFKDAKELLKRYPNASFLELERAGHNVHIDQPEILAQALERWTQLLQPETGENL